MGNTSKSRRKSANNQTFEQRQEAKRALEETKKRAQDMMQTRKETRKLKAKKRLEKKKRKEENEVMSGQYQVIKKTENIRKWHKSARKQLQIMGPDQIAKLMGTK